MWWRHTARLTEAITENASNLHFLIWLKTIFISPFSFNDNSMATGAKRLIIMFYTNGYVCNL